AAPFSRGYLASDNTTPPAESRSAQPARAQWTTGFALVGLGLCASILGAVVIRSYNGGLPFHARYAETVGQGFGSSLAALQRPGVLGYAQILLASGGWLGLMAPVALVHALTSLALTALS